VKKNLKNYLKRRVFSPSLIPFGKPKKKLLRMNDLWYSMKAD